jgi:GLPGLI family protein
MKKNILFIVMLYILSCQSFAQTSSGVATYKYVDWFGQPTEFKLYFDNEKSKYIANKGAKSRLNKVGETVLTKDNFSEATTVNKTIFTYFIDEEGDVVFKNWKDSTLVVREIQRHYPLIVREPKLPKMNWQLIEEFKKIGKLNCQKAITTFRGRKYEVWFTHEIPIPTGPWKLHGLPGLILEAQDETKKHTYLFVDIILPIEDSASDELNYTPKIGDEVKLKDYNDEVKKREEEYNRTIVSKAAQRGATISITPHNNPPQELNFEQ